jgi:hypothetical protein
MMMMMMMMMMMICEVGSDDTDITADAECYGVLTVPVFFCN